MGGYRQRVEELLERPNQQADSLHLPPPLGSPPEIEQEQMPEYETAKRQAQAWEYKCHVVEQQVASSKQQCEEQRIMCETLTAQSQSWKCKFEQSARVNPNQVGCKECELLNRSIERFKDRLSNQQAATKAASMETNGLIRSSEKLKNQLANQQAATKAASLEASSAKIQATTTTKSLLEVLDLFGDLSTQVRHVSGADAKCEQLSAKIRAFQTRVHSCIQSFHSVASQTQPDEELLQMSTAVQTKLLSQARELLQAVVGELSSDLSLKAVLPVPDVVVKEVSPPPQKVHKQFSLSQMEHILMTARNSAWDRSQADVAKQRALDRPIATRVRNYQPSRYSRHSPSKLTSVHSVPSRSPRAASLEPYTPRDQLSCSPTHPLQLMRVTYAPRHHEHRN